MLTITLNPSLDLEASVPTVEPDHKLHCDGLRRSPGGGGINVARVASRLGASTQALFFSGGDSGRALQAAVAAEGVDVIACPIAEPTRESFTVDELSTGRQFRFLLPGPSVTKVERGHFIELVAAHSRPHRHVVVSGSLPEGVEDDYLEAVIRHSRAGGAEVIVDTSGPALLVAARAGVFLLKPSLRELSTAVGRQLGTASEISAAAREVLSLGDNRSAVVSLGATGALLVRPGKSDIAVTAPPVVPVSVVGAGDSMVAAIAVALEQGCTLADAVRYGVVAGSATVSRAGSNLCLADDVERLFRKMPALAI